MSPAPCLRCGQPLREDEEVCASCGQRRGAPNSPRPARKNGPITVLVVIGGAALIGYAGWTRLGAGAESSPIAASAPATPPTPPTNQAPAVPAAAPLALNAPAALSAPPVAAPVAAPAVKPPHAERAAPARADDEEAELPPVPRDLKPGNIIYYGVVYDLATKKPVERARIIFTWPGGTVETRTDAHGWYGVVIPLSSIGAGEISVNALESRHRPGALQEQETPLAANSDVRRRTIAEEAADLLPPVTFARQDVPLAELDLVLIPLSWPEGMAPAVVADAVDPPIPEEPDEKTCRYYGIVYDLATKKPLRRLSLDFRIGTATTHRFTDRLGRYTVDFPVRLLEMGLTVTGTAPGYRPGLMTERDPLMRLLNAKERRSIADVADLAFDPLVLPDDCDDGLIRFDLATVPQRWPGR